MSEPVKPARHVFGHVCTDAPPSLLDLADATDVPRWPRLRALAEAAERADTKGRDSIPTLSNIIAFPAPQRPRTDLDAVMDTAYVAPACSHGQALYRVGRDLVAASELAPAANVKRQWFTYMQPGAEPSDIWFATVVLIACRCRPFTSHEVH